MTFTNLEPRSCNCGCGKVFSPKTYNELYATVTCAQRAARRRRQDRGKAERAAEALPLAARSGWTANPTVAVLEATEALLIAQGREEGRTFHGNVPQWQPTDGRVLWAEAADGSGWNMVFVG